MSKKRLLLISNSYSHGANYLDHCAEAIASFLEDAQEVFFVPFAKHSSNWEANTNTARERFAEFGVQLHSILDLNHEARDPHTTAFFVGGGNTFRLLSTLYVKGLTRFIAENVMSGVPYIGASAGSNVACPTIMTTNDMPIVQTSTLEAMGLVPFQINAHYLDADPESTHKGETREERITEFHEENSVPVIGLREGSWLRVEDELVMLEGTTGAVLFRRDQTPEACTPNSDVTELLGS